LLPIQLTSAELQKVFAAIEQNPNSEFSIDLELQTFTIVDSDVTFSFEIGKYKKMCLQNGYDDIDYLLSQTEKVEAFEKVQVIY